MMSIKKPPIKEIEKPPTIEIEKLTFNDVCQVIDGLAAGEQVKVNLTIPHWLKKQFEQVCGDSETIEYSTIERSIEFAMRHYICLQLASNKQKDTIDKILSQKDIEDRDWKSYEEAVDEVRKDIINRIPT
ncbi:hypothetical protein AltI4_18640 [Alteromonas sp. I4]|nr:hypothetical protein AltI4_18640 [Alteromonas sp. I4]